MSPLNHHYNHAQDDVRPVHLDSIEWIDVDIGAKFDSRNVTRKLLFDRERP